jgi:hypothetical protein
LTGGNVPPDSQKMEYVADAMLYVGSRDTLTQVFVPRSELADTPYGKDFERRVQIQLGRAMDFTEASEARQYQRPPEQIVSNGMHRVPPTPQRALTTPYHPARHLNNLSVRRKRGEDPPIRGRQAILPHVKWQPLLTSQTTR